ncbi:MAG: PilZ [Hyphomicrobiales bacterium]|nr:PilZ [Hyphomicrobiales bacterium]
MEEKRSKPRRRVFKGAIIVFNERRSTIDCTVRNLSESGALLVVISIVGVPDAFDLQVSDGTRHSCRVVRRTPTQLGVEFLAAAD